MTILDVYQSVINICEYLVEYANALNSEEIITCAEIAWNSTNRILFANPDLTKAEIIMERKAFYADEIEEMSEACKKFVNVLFYGFKNNAVSDLNIFTDTYLEFQSNIMLDAYVILHSLSRP